MVDDVGTQRSCSSAQTASAAGEVEAASEHRGPLEHDTFALVEQLVGPGDRSSQRLVPFRTATSWPPEESEPVVKPAQHLRWRHRPARGRRPVRWPTELPSRRWHNAATVARSASVEPRTCCRRRSPVPVNNVVASSPSRGDDICGGRARRRRPSASLLVARIVTAGQRDVIAATSHACCVDDVLAVVDEDQHTTAPTRVEDRLERRRASLRCHPQRGQRSPPQTLSGSTTGASSTMQTPSS